MSCLLTRDSSHDSDSSIPYEPVRLSGPDVEGGVERGELGVAHRELLAARQARGVGGVALEAYNI